MSLEGWIQNRPMACLYQYSLRFSNFGRPNVGFYLENVGLFLEEIRLFLQNVGLFLGNVGCFLGIVRHCGKEKFEVRVRVCSGGKCDVL